MTTENQAEHPPFLRPPNHSGLSRLPKIAARSHRNCRGWALSELGDTIQESRRVEKSVNAWKVTSRYEAKTETEARALFAAITDKPHGVMIWIRTYW
jgi:hypothetical protein